MDWTRDQQKDIVKKILYYSGYYSLYEHLHKPSENHLLILMFHNVVDDAQQSHWFAGGTPSRTQFEAVLITLKSYYRVVSVEDAVREIRDNGKLREKSAAITLDDGYSSAYKIVFPLLRKYDITATIFLPTDWIDGRLTPWWLALTVMIDQCDLTMDTVTKVEKIMGRSVGLDANSLRVPATAKRVLLVNLRGDLMRKNDATCDRILQELRGALIQWGEPATCIEEPMTWEQVSEMGAYGIRFGAHTCSHSNLSHVNLETAEREIVESKSIIERHLGTEVAGFAYPYGDDVAGYRRLKPVLEKHDFRYACTSWPGYVNSASSLYLLGRISIPITSSPAIIARTLSLEYTSKL